MTAALQPRSERTRLQFTGGYEVNLGELARVLHVAVAYGPSKKIARGELAAATGLSMVRIGFLGSMLVGMDLIRPGAYLPTPLGMLVQANDPFFDDLGTLWFAHYAIASNPRHLVWNRFANLMVSGSRHFTTDDLRGLFGDLKDSHSDASATRHVNKEIRAVVNAYTRQHLTRLAYLRVEGDGYRLGCREPVPSLVLAACIARFRDRFRAGDTAVPVDDLVAADNSPGVVLQLPTDRLRATLEELRSEPGFSLESRGDLDQVRLAGHLPDSAWMRRYYDGR